MKRILPSLFFALAVLAVGISSLAAQIIIDFETAGQFTGNFRNIGIGSSAGTQSTLATSPPLTERIFGRSFGLG